MTLCTCSNASWLFRLFNLMHQKTLNENLIFETYSASPVYHYIPVRCAPVLAVLAVMHAFCLRPDYRYLVCRIATYLSVFYNPIAICSKLSVYCYFVRNCLCVGILFKIALVFAAKTIMLEHCPIFVVFVVTYTYPNHFVIFNPQCKVFAFFV